MKFARHHFAPVAPLAALVFGLASLQAAEPNPQQPMPDELDLRTAIRFALSNNFSIRQARERIKQQDGVVVEVSARDIPTVAANASYQLNDQDLAQSFPASDRAWGISLTASQVIYAGGGVRSAIKSSTLVREAALLDLKSVVNDALLMVRTAFYNVLLAQEKITVQEKNLELLNQQLKTTTNRFDAGTVSSFEKLRGEVAVANAKVPLITAKNDWRLAVETLRQALGYATNTPEYRIMIPKFVGTLAYLPENFEFQAAIDAVRSNRPDLQRIAMLVSSREQSVAVAKSGSKPTVSAFGGWQLRKGSTDSFGDSKDGWLVGVQSQWNIFDGRATAGRVAQARSVLDQTKLTLAEAQLAAEVEVRRAFSLWQQATELADASKKVVAQAEEAVRLSEVRYSSGTGTQLDVLSVQVDLTTARTNQLQAFYAHTVAVATLRKAMGQGDEFL